MDGRDFLKVADTLLAGNTEAEWRSAVSRAYYAAFHVARELLGQCGFQVPQGERAHAYLWLRLSNAGDPRVQNAGARLQIRRRERNQADYDMNRKIVQAVALVQVQAAKDVVNVLDAVTGPLGTQITDAIKTYERDVLKEVTWHK